VTDLTPSRRAFAAGGLAATLTASAGCLGALGDVGGGGDADRQLQLTLRREGDSLRDGFVVDLEATRPDVDEEAFAAALAGETYTTQYRKPFHSRPEDPEYALQDGTYYRLGSVVVDEAETTHPVLRLDPVEDDAEAPAAESLPDVDQRAVRVAHMAARARGDEGGVPWGLVERGGYVYRDEERAAESRLLTGESPARVRFRERTYAVATTTETFHEPVYRATVEPVADDPEGMEAVLRAQFVTARVAREDLPQAARDVLREAEARAYAEAHPYSEAFREVLLALHERAYLDGNVRKDAGVETSEREMVRYDGTYFEYVLRFVSDG